MPGKDDSFRDFVLDQLDGLRPVSCRAMFGGYGLYHAGVFFAIIHKGRLYFKTDEPARRLYVAHGMQPFRPNSKQTLRNYYEVPADVIEDPQQLSAWAQRAVGRLPADR